ncbi:uncharacterized protein Z520_11222 [Fonsecaea multimorphosa CBS 102226]|uniref:Uncharacterized protein n=1 Tax=Fonsecaea multimorphosa CBS 102226 TaxID=1442371 RepID=A0A0D2GUF6_9EURO|nr:uncharacterized protein Z520_11222 [Fonsecaea multimorphosa CBS 102226]KIX93165.1 hypothetical protein Z520_11222 [Fonsecaea multimorphosa CBS 102226]OAL18366.1 hypothetical protein AYO22_10782 [Fonsecaea multimorphosa]
MNDAGPDTPSKPYVVPQLRQHTPARKNGRATELLTRFDVLRSAANAASRNLGTTPALSSILESPPYPPGNHPDMAHLAEETPLAAESGGWQCASIHDCSSSPSFPIPAHLQHPIVAFKKLLPESLLGGDPDVYLVYFQEQLMLQTMELTLAARRENLPRHLDPPLVYLTALANTVDKVKQPQRYAAKVTRARKREQIQKLLDALEKGFGGLLEVDDSAGQDKVLDENDDGFNDLITTYDSDLRRQLEALKPRMVGCRFTLGVVVLVVGVLAMLIHSRSLY